MLFAKQCDGFIGKAAAVTVALKNVECKSELYGFCHGDYNPKNIIIDKDGELHVVDLVHASQGNASADVARTYLLLALESKDIADKYMDLFCEKSGTQKRYVQQWLPIVAAAQLAKKRPEEKDLLFKWLDVFEYQ